MGSKRKVPADETPLGFGDILEKKGVPATSPHTEQVTFQEAVPGTEGKTLLIQNAVHCTQRIYHQLEFELSDPVDGAVHTLSGGLIQANSLDNLALETYPQGALRCVLGTICQLLFALGIHIIGKFARVNPPEKGASFTRPASHGQLADKQVKIKPQGLHFDTLLPDVEARVIVSFSERQGGAQMEQLLADGSTQLVKVVLPSGSAYGVTADLLQGFLDGWGRHGPTGGEGNSISLVLSITFQSAPIKLCKTPLTSSVSSTISSSGYMTPMGAISFTAQDDDRAGPYAAFIPPRQKAKSFGAAVQQKMERLLGFKGSKPPQYTWVELGEMDYEDAFKLCKEEAARRGEASALANRTLTGSAAPRPSGMTNQFVENMQLGKYTKALSDAQSIRAEAGQLVRMWDCMLAADEEVADGDPGKVNCRAIEMYNESTCGGHEGWQRGGLASRQDESVSRGGTKANPGSDLTKAQARVFPGLPPIYLGMTQDPTLREERARAYAEALRADNDPQGFADLPPEVRERLRGKKPQKWE